MIRILQVRILRIIPGTNIKHSYSKGYAETTKRDGTMDFQPAIVISYVMSLGTAVKKIINIKSTRGRVGCLIDIRFLANILTIDTTYRYTEEDSLLLLSANVSGQTSKLKTFVNVIPNI
ncbi:hypothetical protein DPMN_010055 [Dreissena polymorpha]|uniref:Uncharacterized protein n=1 Tax=Dreissena polymorpha TaxID=45954 RepID=A0A9D4N2F1_DREPO|nr:hypothetical protein DPMN_010055 [Dreissena polymorpha]